MKPCKCGHDVEIHEHYSYRTNCAHVVAVDNDGKPVYCKCKGPRPFFKHLKFWLG